MNKRIRDLFPILKRQKDLVYLDSGATALKPQIVIDRVSEYYTEYTSNVHRGMYKNAIKADEEFEKVRMVMSRFIGANSPKETVFVSGTTEGINLVAKTIGKAKVGKGDEMIVTEMEHHSNLVPWQVLRDEAGAKLKWLSFDDEGKIDEKRVGEMVNERTKILAITGMSNVLGTINDIKKITRMAKKLNPEIVVVVDGAQMVPHLPVSVCELGVDFLVFSAHKLYGPTGVGVLWGREELLNEMPPFLTGGGMISRVTMDGVEYRGTPEKFEAGTPNIAGVIGMGAAIEWLNDEAEGMEAVRKYEEEITGYALEKLQAMDEAEVYGPKRKSERGGLVAFNVRGVHPHDTAQILSDRGVCVRAGHHCAMPIHLKLGIPGSVRASFGVYTSKEDIDKLIEGIERVVVKFGR